MPDAGVRRPVQAEGRVRPPLEQEVGLQARGCGDEDEESPLGQQRGPRHGGVPHGGSRLLQQHAARRPGEDVRAGDRQGQGRAGGRQGGMRLDDGSNRLCGDGGRRVARAVGEGGLQGGVREGALHHHEPGRERRQGVRFAGGHPVAALQGSGLQGRGLLALRGRDWLDWQRGRRAGHEGRRLRRHPHGWRGGRDQDGHGFPGWVPDGLDEDDDFLQERGVRRQGVLQRGERTAAQHAQGAR
mmetsp:Transcript_38053/g.101973  ORF Transcript_38053/g.101973 Transcript_38053/m.101973 type:complete len:242 (+) Transcript_38053:827-1552(+)